MKCKHCILWYLIRSSDTIRSLNRSRDAYMRIVSHLSDHTIASKNIGLNILPLKASLAIQYIEFFGVNRIGS